MKPSNRGKNICKELKSIRKRIAEENDIPLEIKECTYEGPCRGTCPRCEAEVRYLENALASKLQWGKVATVAGLALGLASCGGQVLEGEVPMDDSFLEDELPTGDSVDTMPTTPHWREDASIDVVCGGDFAIDSVAMAELTPPPDSAILEEEGGIDDEPWMGIVVEDEPEYPGGVDALYKFLADNIQYPQLALENGIEGKVYVTFVVETDGSIGNPRLLRDIGGGCGQEAIRVVKMMPKWKPGKQKGKTVRSQYNLPIKFELSKDRPRIIEGKARIVEVDSGVDSVKVIVK